MEMAFLTRRSPSAGSRRAADCWTANSFQRSSWLAPRKSAGTDRSVAATCDLAWVRPEMSLSAMNSRKTSSNSSGKDVPGRKNANLSVNPLNNKLMKLKINSMWLRGFAGAALLGWARHTCAHEIEPVAFSEIGIPYAWFLEISAGESAETPPDHVGAWSWDEDTFPATTPVDDPHFEVRSNRFHHPGAFRGHLVESR